MTDNATPAATLAPGGPAPALASLLRLQEADVRRQQLDNHLKQIPTEMASLRRRVDEEKTTIEARRKAVQELEVRRKEIDTRLKSAEGQVLKYKTQQIEVRKNDEYQALSHQIATAEAEVSAIETEEIEQLLKIDEARGSLIAAETEYKRRTAELDGEIALVVRREEQLRADLAAQAGSVEEATTVVPEVWRRAYTSAQNRGKRPPYVAPIADHMCGGCHLRVSNEISEAARHGGKPVHCDNCGRVVYWPS